ncbi:MAG: four helix bundle protein [Lutimonas sp.]
MHHLQNLIIWEKSMELAKSTYNLTINLPETEKFGLMTQMRRSAISIPSNIAEGAGRSSDKEFKHFLGIANGSVFELQTQLLLAKNLSLIQKMEVDPLIDICTELQKMIYSFRNNLNNKIEHKNQSKF